MSGAGALERQPAAPAAPLPLAGLRVLVIMPSIPVQGMERANLAVMRLLSGQGAAVLCVTEARHGAALRAEVERAGCRWEVCAAAEPLRLSPDPRAWLRMLRAVLGAGRALRRIARRFRPGLLYVTNLTFFLYALPLIATSRVPVVFRAPNPPGTPRGALRRALGGLLWRRVVFPRCALVVTNSEYSAGRLRAAGCPAQVLRVIPNPVPLRAGGTPADAPRLDPARFNVVFLGRIRPAKGVAELCAAARRLVAEDGDLVFHLAGEHAWRNPFAERLMGEVRAQGLAERIRFLGEIRDVFGLLRQCDLHVCPSTSPVESLPNVLLEAKHAGVPSVVFPVAGLPEAVSHRVDGWVCEQPTAEALCAAIRYFRDHPDRRRAAGAAARRSLSAHAEQRVAGAWLDALRALPR